MAQPPPLEKLARTPMGGARSLVGVAGNTVWSRMANDVPYLWDPIPMKSYIGIYFTFLMDFGHKMAAKMWKDWRLHP